MPSLRLALTLNQKRHFRDSSGVSERIGAPEAPTRRTPAVCSSHTVTWRILSLAPRLLEGQHPTAAHLWSVLCLLFSRWPDTFFSDHIVGPSHRPDSPAGPVSRPGPLTVWKQPTQQHLLILWFCSAVSVIHSPLWSENIKWRIPELSNSKITFKSRTKWCDEIPRRPAPSGGTGLTPSSVSTPQVLPACWWPPVLSEPPSPPHRACDQRTLTSLNNGPKAGDWRFWHWGHPKEKQKMFSFKWKRGSFRLNKERKINFLRPTTRTNIHLWNCLIYKLNFITSVYVRRGVRWRQTSLVLSLVLPKPMASVKPLKFHNSNFASVTRGAPPTLRPYYLWVVAAVDCWTVPHFLRLSISSYTHCNYKTEIHHIRVLLEFLSISKYVLHLHKNVENKKQKTPALPKKILWSY